MAEKVRCWACAAKDRLAASMTDNGAQIPHGTKFRIIDRSN